MASSSNSCPVLLLFLLPALLSLSAAGASSKPHVYSKQTDAELILPPWVDAYGAPSATLKLYYNGSKLKAGRLYGINKTQDAPHVTFKGSAVQKYHYYTLVTLDFDAPSPANATFKNYLHWLVTNIPGSIKKSQEVYEEGDVVVPYAGPSPPFGVHRYVFLLFDQGAKKIDIQVPPGRALFGVRGLASAGHLGYPIGGTLFRAEAGKF